ncbi:hypothetical protein JW933_07095 [candidate division FCPU426 bacterium]|nr:hypothetical protein [candidate division FCPU426 bacterium]
MTPFSSRDIITWSLVAIVLAALITLLVQKLFNLASRTLPTWTLQDARQKFAHAYPGKDIYQVARLLLQRDRVFSRMLVWLPWQCLLVLFMLATLWAFVIPAKSRFWLLVVQNIFVFEFLILALYPAFRLLQRIQRLTIERIQELLTKK